MQNPNGFAAEFANKPWGLHQETNIDWKKTPAFSQPFFSQEQFVLF